MGRVTFRVCCALLTSLGLGACTNEAPVCGGPGESCALGPAPACFEYPDGPYGVDVGDTVEDFELSDCDGERVSLSQVVSQSGLTLLNVGAGWCAPCIEETRTMEAEVFQRFCGRGLRIVQVLFEDRDLEPASSVFCQGWRDRYGLTFPVLRDPLFVTQRLFDDHATQTPLNLLIDSDGVIVYREVGTAAVGLDAAIQAHLPAL